MDIAGTGLTLPAHLGRNTAEMNLSQLSIQQHIPAHDLDVQALRNEVRYQGKLIAALIDLLQERSGSLEFFAGIKALAIERDRIGLSESL